ncbi:hypothetical protein DPEC_G00268670 [Dallia pectoralis]|uniref:Uncharacterized protein n=1 Tax=Dallia pectoralis TaxID=75939 RepID=A0ACC2FPB7_DALPE|nr:hypothetical protein DPEC_G00268670 [Dallia pectoralis]
MSAVLYMGPGATAMMKLKCRESTAAHDPLTLRNITGGCGRRPFSVSGAPGGVSRFLEFANSPRACRGLGSGPYPDHRGLRPVSNGPGSRTPMSLCNSAANTML